MVHASEKKGGGRRTYLNFSFLIIYIIVPLYKRKFRDSHIILVYFTNENFKHFNAELSLSVICPEEF